MTSIIGHQQQREALAELASSERLPSTLLFTGIAGIGKHKVAKELASQLLCFQPSPASLGGCGNCKSCTLQRSGNHPDLHTLQFESDAGVSVNDVRGVLERLSLHAFMGRRKVAILNDADSLSIIGANTILKALEEPRPETFFILVASHSSRLPPTLLSRCQKWFFDRLSPAQIQAILQSQGEDSVDEALAILADGSMVGLSSIKDRAHLWEEIREIIEKAYHGDAAAVAKAALTWGSDKNTLQERLTLLRSAIRTKLAQQASDCAAAAVWSNALQNALDAEYFIVDRHSNPTLCFMRILSSCNKQLAEQYQRAPNLSVTLGEELM